MAKLHIQGASANHGDNRGPLHRGGAKPEATTSGGFHGGSGRPKGTVHEAPTLPQVNAANYSGHKIRRK
jgi:hypothetical protein